ncbi:serine/threonine-protein kinase [Rhizobium tumorigenes]|uniref:Serine/threonine-protein kinase n=1 Tax=Rhizobium tumorigenes TaxID=2041385 RepID=A0AAF1KTD2_9HYPH|nr:serine/threonine-protein kinase [Rhizobium tumorigenes]WFR98738.1 serine/threonine-protein kinase [Rhizobium tumorigenes]
MADNTPSGFHEVQQRFAALWQSLVTDGTRPRPAPERRGLLDQVRCALDRGEERLSDRQTAHIANTFKLEDKIHEGTSTVVHRARHRDLGTYHAVKMLKDCHAGDPVAARLLLHEAEIGLALRHPHIVATQALLRLEDGRPALVFEWCSQSLSDRLREGSIAIAEIFDITRSVLSALDGVHEAGWVHCDLSPANLLFDGDRPGRIRLADFGVAVAVGTRQSELDLSFAGQPDFAAPEQIAGKPLDARCDLYAAGRLLSLLLERCDGASEDISISALRAFAAQLTRSNPADRPENAKAAQAVLGGFQV